MRKGRQTVSLRVGYPSTVVCDSVEFLDNGIRITAPDNKGCSYTRGIRYADVLMLVRQGDSYTVNYITHQSTASVIASRVASVRKGKSQVEFLKVERHSDKQTFLMNAAYAEQT